MPTSPDAFPTVAVSLSDLLLRWQELRQQGGNPQAAELCAHCPELAGELEKQIHAVLAMEALLAVGRDTPTDSDSLAVPQPAAPGDRGAVDFFPPGYEILQELAQGGMGVVYKARQVRPSRLVAIKRIRAGVHARPNQLARFRTEAEALARVQHPHIVGIIEVGEHDGQPFLAMELVEGESLAQKLARSLLPARQAAGLIETLARAIHAAHDRGIVHRDLKPSNVLLSGAGAPKITDFGLAKCLDNDAGPTRTGEIMGTPSYLAPEQAAGKAREVGPATDVWALGTILYEAITGRPPFQGESTLDTLEQVRHRDPVPPSRLQPKVPRDLETICLKCLEKEPRQRYPNAQALADDLGRFQAGEPVRARPASLAERCLKWVKRRPAQAAVAAVSATALLVLLAVWAALTARLTAERNRAQYEEGRAKEQEGIARANQQLAETERDRADQQWKRAETLLYRCSSAVEEYAATAVVAKEEKIQTGEPGSVLYVLARFYATTAAAVPKDAGLTESDSKKLTEEYAARAVYLLRRAGEIGFFANPRNRERLRQDKELAPLRSRPDFQALVRRVGGEWAKGGASDK
jgi:tRNA A-37 threonylcarbamoyl transferase component Bud32